MDSRTFLQIKIPEIDLISLKEGYCLFFQWLPILIGLANLLAFFYTKELQLCVLGSGQLATEFISVFLKYYFIYPRPEGATRTDPGMPSSHAAWMAYTVVSLSFYSLRWNAISSASLLSLFFSAILVGHSRILAREHFFEQVFFGYATGITMALIWRFIGDHRLSVLTLTRLSSQFKLNYELK